MNIEKLLDVWRNEIQEACVVYFRGPTGPGGVKEVHWEKIEQMKLAIMQVVETGSSRVVNVSPTAWDKALLPIESEPDTLPGLIVPPPSPQPPGDSEPIPPESPKTTPVS